MDAARPATSATSRVPRTPFNTRCGYGSTKRLNQDLQVEGEAPPLDVVQVALDPALDRRVTPPAVDLGPAGDTGLHLVAQHVAGHAPPELLDEARALGARPDEAHLAAEHVEALRQLVE